MAIKGKQGATDLHGARI